MWKEWVKWNIEISQRKALLTAYTNCSSLQRQIHHSNKSVSASLVQLFCRLKKGPRNICREMQSCKVFYMFRNCQCDNTHEVHFILGAFVWRQQWCDGGGDADFSAYLHMRMYAQIEENIWACVWMCIMRCVVYANRFWAWQTTMFLEALNSIVSEKFHCLKIHLKLFFVVVVVIVHLVCLHVCRVQYLCARKSHCNSSTKKS